MILFRHIVKGEAPVRSWIMSAALVMALVSGCGEKAPYPSVSSLSRRWLEIKATLPDNYGGTANLEAQLGELAGALERFFASPAGRVYRIQKPQIALPAAAIGEAADRLAGAARAGDRDAVFAEALEIDAAMDQLLGIDAGLSDLIQLRYFELFFFFALLVMLIILALWLLNRRLEKAARRERQSPVFSRNSEPDGGGGQNMPGGAGPDSGGPDRRSTPDHPGHRRVARRDRAFFRCRNRCKRCPRAKTAGKPRSPAGSGDP
jgi:hypothetical protein